MKKNSGIIFLLLFAIAQTVFAADPVHIRLATTTSVDDSGLLQNILPQFESKYGIKVDVLAVGTGKALKLAENGDVDVVLVHDPKAEEDFMKKGFGVNRRSVMQNDFVILGPAADPAKVKAAKNAKDAFTALSQSSVSFISRGDESGTHKKELSIWETAGGKPDPKNYLETGQGMSPTLRVATEKQAYVLSDRATYLAEKDKLQLTLLFEGGDDLLNPYSVIAVNPARYKDIKYMQVMIFIAWLTSPEGQKIIGDYQKNGVVLFHPTAVP